MNSFTPEQMQQKFGTPQTGQSFTPEQMQQKFGIVSQTQKERQKRISQGLPVALNENRVKQNFVTSIARGIAKPFARTVAGFKAPIKAQEQAQQGKDLQSPEAIAERYAPMKSKFFGDIYGIGEQPIYEEATSQIGKADTLPYSTIFTQPGKQVQDAIGVGAELVSNISGGGATVRTGSAILKGLLPSAKALAKEGALSGAMVGLGEAQQQGKGVGGTVLQTAGSALLGGVAAPIVGTGLAMLPKAARTVGTATGRKELVQNVSEKATKLGDTTSEGIMNRLVPILPTDRVKFKNKFNGETIGEYLSSRGKFKTQEALIDDLAQTFTDAKGTKLSALQQINTKIQPKHAQDAIDELMDKALVESTPTVKSPYLDTVLEYNTKLKEEGLTPAEYDALKSLYEREVRLGYNKLSAPEKVNRATNLSNAMRKEVEDIADSLGFTNIKEVNQDISKAKTLLDMIGKKMNRADGNNAIGLSDWVLLGNSIGEFGSMRNGLLAFGAKKLLQSPMVQKTLARKTRVSSIKEPTKAVFRKNGVMSEGSGMNTLPPQQ